MVLSSISGVPATMVEADAEGEDKSMRSIIDEVYVVSEDHTKMRGRLGCSMRRK